jgi:hypothetical protein
MEFRTKNPAAPASAHRVLEIVATAKRLDISNPTETLSQSLAVRRTAQRFNITPTHARVVCELYGLGGTA